MGRIFRNPRTAQEKGGCETCHGAGSLHVKAGGGRGVGGIISFRKDDPAARSPTTTPICLSCHEQGRPHRYWQGSTHELRDVGCTNCHTVMRNVSPKLQLKTVDRDRYLLPVPQEQARGDLAHARTCRCAKAR